jgi:fructose-bisphosphate aldolase class 1
VRFASLAFSIFHVSVFPYLFYHPTDLSDLFFNVFLSLQFKVDTGLQPLPGADPIETWCTGLDGLKERAAAYYAQGARFAKWRAVLQITGDGCPSALSLQENAWGLARYARAVQESG